MLEEYGAGLGGGMGLLPIEMLFDICRLGLTGGVGRLHDCVNGWEDECGGGGGHEANYCFNPSVKINLMGFIDLQKVQ